LGQEAFVLVAENANSYVAPVRTRRRWESKAKVTAAGIGSAVETWTTTRIRFKGAD